MASGVATAGSLVALLASSERELAAAERYAIAGKIGELAATAALHLEVRRASPRAARPPTRGLSGASDRGDGVDGDEPRDLADVGPLAPARAHRRAPRRRRLAALRFAIHHAGKQSARDPRASSRRSVRA